MEEASNSFALELDKVNFRDANVPILSKSDPLPTCDANILKTKLKNQMVTGVRWRETMEIMLREGISNLVEIGPGNVLSGLAKRSLKEVVTNQISTANDLGY